MLLYGLRINFFKNEEILLSLKPYRILNVYTMEYNI